MSKKSINTIEAGDREDRGALPLPPPTTPVPGARTRPARTSAGVGAGAPPAPPATPGSSYQMPLVIADDFDNDREPYIFTTLRRHYHFFRSQPATTSTSSGSSLSKESADEITVGSWARSATYPSRAVAVVARLECGNLNYYIVARTLDGTAVLGLTTTTVAFNDICFFPTFYSLDATTICTKLESEFNRRSIMTEPKINKTAANNGNTSHFEDETRDLVGFGRGEAFALGSIRKWRQIC